MLRNLSEDPEGSFLGLGFGVLGYEGFSFGHYFLSERSLCPAYDLMNLDEAVTSANVKPHEVALPCVEIVRRVLEVVLASCLHNKVHLFVSGPSIVGHHLAAHA